MDTTEQSYFHTIIFNYRRACVSLGASVVNSFHCGVQGRWWGLMPSFYKLFWFGDIGDNMQSIE